jgi:N-glycosylase/DNA lyase
MLEFPLRGPSGEPIDLRRTLDSHGLNSLPPGSLDEQAATLEITLALGEGQARTVRIGPGREGFGRVQVLGGIDSEDALEAIRARLEHVLRLDEDLSDFYTQIADDPDLAWANQGAGRMMRGATVFEDVIKTICTTNCTWSATVRMVSALCEHLGDKIPAAPETGWQGRAFPTPAQMAAADEDFYQKVMRAGYRTRYLRSIASDVAEGAIDLEPLGRAGSDEISDEEVEKRLLALPGVGPYAAAHIMLLLGRYSRLVLDSWTRPKYARLVGRESVPDAEILERFAGYERYAGLAFWLFVTRDWAPLPSD